MRLPKLNTPTKYRVKCPFCGKLFWSHNINTHITKALFKEIDYKLPIKHKLTN